MKRSNQIPVAEHVNQVLKEIARKMGGGQLRVGYLENSPSGTYDDGTPVAAVAFWNEFGHEGNFPSPPRPTFGPMVIAKSPGWPAMMAHLAILFNYDGRKVLEQMGSQIQSDLRESIVNTQVDPLSPTTLVLRSKFWTNPQDIRIKDVLAAQQTAAANDGMMASGTQAKPLVWTGKMLRAVDWEVVKS